MVTAYERRSFSGTPALTTITADPGASGTSISIADATGWPTTTNGPFEAVIAPGESTEEKIQVTTRTTTTLSPVERGVDNTTGIAHASGTAIRPCLTARDLNESNLLVAELLLQATAAGQIPVVDAAASFAMLQAKTSGQLLIGNGTTLVSVAMSGDVTINSSGVTAIGSNKITNAMLQDGIVGNVETAFTFASYTPTLTQSGAVTKTVTSAEYMQIGKFVSVRARLTVTGTGTADQSIQIGLPVTAAFGAGCGGTAIWQDTSSGKLFRGVVRLVSTSLIDMMDTNSVNFLPLGADATLGGNVALQSGDVIDFSVSYEAA